MNTLTLLLLAAGFTGFALGCLFMGAMYKLFISFARRPTLPPALVPKEWSPGAVEHLRAMTVLSKRPLR